MGNAKAVHQNEILRHLPSVDELLRTSAGQEYTAAEGPAAAASAAREAIAEIRSRTVTAQDSTELLKVSEDALAARLASDRRSSGQKVINATGVVIHTNLGRAPLSDAAKAAVLGAAGYCDLEFDLRTGKRGRRGGRVERMIAEITGAEDALVVNNGAAAAFLVLTALAGGGEVIISRGELVEIGGDFRIPDVLTASGATLREVGTTNRTKLSDYARAVTSATRMILRVHPSNFRIVGFTAAPSHEELAALAHEHRLIFYEDLGSGALVDITDAGIPGEPIAKDVISAGVDIVSFSGDKLLGGPQAGIIAGQSTFIAELRRYPLFRVLRPDKTTYAALDATLRTYRRGEAFEAIPVLRQLSMPAEEIASRAGEVMRAASPLERVRLEIVDGYSAVGGGAGPGMQIETKLISISHAEATPEEIMTRLRNNDPIPVIARIEDDRVVLDLRTVAIDDEPVVIAAIRQIDT